MIIIYAVQKLLNISRLKPALFISNAAEGQLLHHWYARLVATGSSGKLMVMYVHQPSLMMILCKGKTIQGTWAEFRERLPGLLKRSGFPLLFIDNEMKQMGGYVVSKTNSKSMLAFMNQIILRLEIFIQTHGYENIAQDNLEDSFMSYLHLYPGTKHYSSPMEQWEKILESYSGQ
jgi:hypothetical protein